MSIDYANLSDEKISHSSINLLLILADNDDFVQKQILHLAKQDDHLKYMISGTMSFLVSYTKQNKFFVLKLFQECLKIKPQTKKEDILVDFRHLIDYYPIEYLKVLIDWIRSSKSIDSSRKFDYQIQEIGQKGNIKEIEALLLDWVSTEKSNPVLENKMLGFLSNIYVGKPIELICLLKQIYKKEKHRTKFIANAIREFLSDEEELNSKTFSEYHEFLLKIADNCGVDTNVSKELNFNLKIIALAYNIQFFKQKIDKQVVLESLKQYPNIERFFTDNNINNMFKEPGHPLTCMLNKTIYTKKETITAQSRYVKTTLTELDTCLGIIGNEQSSVLKCTLSQTTGFNSGFIQAIMYTKLSNNYKVQLDPDIGSKRPDLLVTIDDQDYLFEIYSPQENNDVKYKSGVQVLEGKYVQRKIIKKFTDQLTDFSSKNIPIIAVIDETDEFISEYEKVPLTYPTLTQSICERINKNDSNYWESISAIMSVSCRVERDQFKLYGKIYPTVRSKHPISSNIIQKLNTDLNLISPEITSTEHDGKVFQLYT